MIPRFGLADASPKGKCCERRRRSRAQCLSACTGVVDLQGRSLNLSIRDSTTDYDETVDLQEELSDKLVIGFNAKLVMETLKAFDCANVGMAFGGAKMPMIVEAEDSDFKAIVLPVAME